MARAVTDEVDVVARATAAIGERVHTLMWRSGRTQKQLAAVLNVNQGSISNRLRGKTEWSAIDIAVTAAWLGVEPAELMPEVELLPDDGGDGGAAGAPTRARTWDLRIKSPLESPFASVELEAA
ncbi:immunity repressor [Mycobacterium phage IdentityCrisis]|uniref:Immunity repressor n=1 Tax=Mycobacterium phage IdentityCrisis TaxID=2599866 RepID=A0A5J6THA0_9CAUD|nr:immunity repressor [Mycobacterium phage IdentityCrisis]QFG10055.1 immunity repressor [Mycobacterium phage IdentityCrisis]